MMQKFLTCSVLVVIVTLGSASSVASMQKIYRHATNPKETLSDDSQACFKNNKPFRQLVVGTTPTGNISIGNPKVLVNVIFDTGSDQAVLKTCDSIMAEVNNWDPGVGDAYTCNSNNIYDNTRSSTYLATNYTSTEEGPNKGKVLPLAETITYGSGSADTLLGTETAEVGGRCLNKYTILEIQSDSLKLLHTSKGVGGVLGLQHMKNESLGTSLFSEMRKADLLTSFGYCRDQSGANKGTIIWGDDSKEGTELAVIGQMHWALKLGKLGLDAPPPAAAVPAASDEKKDDKKDEPVTDSITKEKEDEPVKDSITKENIITKQKKSALLHAKQTVSVQGSGASSWWWPFAAAETPEEKEDHEHHATLKASCPDGKCCAILDTGSNIIAGPTDEINAFTKLVGVKPDCSNFKELPAMLFNFGGMDVKVQPEGYVMKVAMPQLPIGWDSKVQKNSTAAEVEEAKKADTKDDDDGQFMSLERQSETPEMSVFEGEASLARAAIGRKWMHVFENLHRERGVDLRDAVAALLNSTKDPLKEEFLCMPALVPIEKKTEFGPLWVMGTPLLQTYYAKFSHGKEEDASPKVHLNELAKTETCKVAPPAKEEAPQQEAAGKKSDMTVLMRSETGRRMQHRPAVVLEESSPALPGAGLIARLPEEIAYPHWAKKLEIV